MVWPTVITLCGFYCIFQISEIMADCRFDERSVNQISIFTLLPYLLHPTPRSVPYAQLGWQDISVTRTTLKKKRPPLFDKCSFFAFATFTHTLPLSNTYTHTHTHKYKPKQIIFLWSDIRHKNPKF